MKNNKKGISAVVATVLIILITVAAVTIIWAAIIPMINDQLNRGTVCLDAMTALTIENKGYTCYVDNGAGNPDDVSVQIAYGSKDIDLYGIQILVSDSSGNTVSWTEDVANNLPDTNGEKVLTYVNAVETPTAVKIAPIVNVGGQQETCDASASVAIIECGP